MEGSGKVMMRSKGTANLCFRIDSACDDEPAAVWRAIPYLRQKIDRFLRSCTQLAEDTMKPLLRNSIQRGCLIILHSNLAMRIGRSQNPENSILLGSFVTYEKY